MFERNNEKWYNISSLVLLMIVLCPPVGIFGVLKHYKMSNFSRFLIVVILACCLFFIYYLIFSNIFFNSNDVRLPYKGQA